MLFSEDYRDCHTFIIILFFFSVKPEDVRLTIFATGNKACLNDTVNVTCTATAHPDVMSFHLFENDKLLRKSSQGTWTIPLFSSGVFTYKCMVNNSLGTANSTTVSLDVGGKKDVHNFLFVLTLCNPDLLIAVGIMTLIIPKSCEVISSCC